MPPVPKDIAVYDVQTARRIAEAALLVRGRPANPAPNVSGGNLGFPTLLLCQASAYIANGASGTLKIYHSATKGSEADTGLTVSAYVRHGVCFAGVSYLVQECDTAFEVLNPTLTILGKLDSTTTAGTTGTVSVWDSYGGSDLGVNVTVLFFNDATAGKYVLANWYPESPTPWLGGAAC